MIHRPYGIVINGELELGLELVIEDFVIQEIRPHTGLPELYILSPAFINAHSHLEYRGMLGKIDEPEYWGWIREITRLKTLQTEDEVMADSAIAAHENVMTGVAAILEHTDRYGADLGMNMQHLEGLLFQEVITILEHDDPAEKLRKVKEKAQNSLGKLTVFLNPHAYHTVDRETLLYFGKRGKKMSIHVAETNYENMLTRYGAGPIADFYKANNVPVEPTGKSVLASLDDLQCVHKNVQLVHCCAINDEDIELIVKRGASVAHCPRSNKRLQCPPAPIRELLDAKVPVGLGMDSAASSGPIDMFAEMRAAIQTGEERAAPVTPEEIWRMATTPSPLMTEAETWRMEKGSTPRIIKIDIPGATSIEEVIWAASPERVSWVQGGP